MKSIISKHQIRLVLVLSFFGILTYLSTALANTSHELIANGTFNNKLEDWICLSDCLIDNYGAIDGNFISLGERNKIQILSPIPSIKIPETNNAIYSFDFRFITEGYEFGTVDDFFMFFVVDAETGNYYIKDTIYSSQGSYVDWEHISYNLTDASDRTVYVSFGVSNGDDPYFTFADIDNISITASTEKTIEQVGVLTIKKHKAAVYWVPSDESGNVRLQLWKKTKKGKWKKVESQKFPTDYLGIQITKLKSKTYYKCRVKFVDSSEWSDWALFQTN